MYSISSIGSVGVFLLMMLGIVGLYIGKIFDQVKERPIFVVSKKINID